MNQIFCTPPMIFFFFWLEKNLGLSNGAMRQGKQQILKYILFFIIKFLQLKKDHNVTTEHGMHKPLTTIYYLLHCYPVETEQYINIEVKTVINDNDDKCNLTSNNK